MSFPLKYRGFSLLVFILRSSLSPGKAGDYPLILNYPFNPSGVFNVKATLLKNLTNIQTKLT